MTMPEKVAQLCSVWPDSGEVAPMQDVFGREIPWPEVAKNGIGQLTRVFGTAPVTRPMVSAGCASFRAPSCP